MHEICQIAFEAHHAACKQSSGSKLGHTPQSKTIRDEEAFFLLKIIGMKEKNTEAYSAKNEPKKRRVRVLSRCQNPSLDISCPESLPFPIANRLLLAYI
jgi:hypothetical protein